MMPQKPGIIYQLQWKAIMLREEGTVLDNFFHILPLINDHYLINFKGLLGEWGGGAPGNVFCLFFCSVLHGTHGKILLLVPQLPHE